MDGVGLKIKVEDIKARQMLVRLGTGIKDQTALCRVMGEVMRDSIETTFAEEGSPAGSWRKLHASTLIRRYETMGKGKRKAFKFGGKQNTTGFLRFAAGKKILTDTGRLKNSITYEPEAATGGNARLVIGTVTRYARIHQLGGVIRPKNGKALRFPIATSAGTQWVTKRSVTMPARPFLVFRPGDSARLTEAITDYLIARSQ